MVCSSSALIYFHHVPGLGRLKAGSPKSKVSRIPPRSSPVSGAIAAFRGAGLREPSPRSARCAARSQGQSCPPPAAELTSPDRLPAVSGSAPVPLPVPVPPDESSEGRQSLLLSSDQSLRKSLLADDDNHWPDCV